MSIDSVVADVVTVDVVTDRMSVVNVVGDLDLRAVQADTKLIRLRLDPPRHLRIDARQATFIDSNGLAALAAVALAVRKNGGTVSTKASTPVRRLLEICGLELHLGLRAKK